MGGENHSICFLKTKDKRTKLMNITGTDNHPRKMAAIIPITSKLSCGSSPFILLFFGLLLMIGISLTISQLKIKTMA
jgi:hypothetical protein